MVRFFAVIAVAAALLFAETPTTPKYPWTSADLVQPETLAKAIQAKTAPKILYVGFPVLYRAAHIPGAVMSGPASKDTGLDSLKTELSKLPKNAEVVLYCGCCPWDKCPNVRPAFKLAREMGFPRVKLLVIPTNMHTDWVAKGYPVEKQ